MPACQSLCWFMSDPEVTKAIDPGAKAALILSTQFGLREAGVAVAHPPRSS
jgi:hypothetical protein